MFRFLAAAIIFGLVFRALRGLLRVAGGGQAPNRVRHPSQDRSPDPGGPKPATPSVRREDVIDVPYEDIS